MSGHPLRRSRRLPGRTPPVWLAALSLAFFAASAGAQEPGRITGQIVDAQSRAPIAQVQVFLEGTGLGTMTRQDGRYMLMNVPSGTYTLRAERIGLGPLSREVVVGAGQAVQADFEMTAQALGLDEVVVTGTAGQARRREIGNSLEQVSFADAPSPTISVESGLQAKAPGVNLLTTSGSIGAGAQIRLRGNVSVAMSNNPLIFVDGVRVYSEAYPSQHGRDFPGGRGAGTSTGTLNDINPQDIERIEVVKGPAATTLYGTEASAGVIQIFTKRGQQGGARWSVETTQSFSRVQPFAPEGMTYGPENRRSEYLYIDPWLSTGHGQRYALSVSGGSGDIKYFLSGAAEDNTGVLPDDFENRYNLRGNLDFAPRPDLGVQWTTSYTNQEVQRTSMGNNAQGLALNAYRLDANYFGDGSKEKIDRVLEYDNFEDVDRFITGLTARHTWGSFANRVTVGYDQAHWEGRNVRRFGYIIYPGGALGVTRWTNETLSFDYVGSYALTLPGDLRNTISWGAQSISEESSEVEGWSEGFPGPGEPTLTSGADTRSYEERMRVITAGVFGQTVFDFRDRYFLTLGMRVDGNSAFGSNFGLQPYPRASFSYVLSDESFWPEALGSMRLRGAYGHAGRAPGAFDAVRTWDPYSWAGQSAFVPRNLGNPDLGPERTKETELGFEASLLQDRLTVNYTYYRQVTEDALFNVNEPASMGNWPAQLRNVGEIRNEGMELAVNGTLLDRRDFGWDVGVNVSTNNSLVVDLGGAAPFNSQGARIAEGQPVMAIWRARRIMNPHERAEPVVSTDPEDQFFGPAWPVRIVQGHTTFRFPRNVILTARGEYQGGHWVSVGPTAAAVGRGNTQWPICQEFYELTAEGRTDEIKAWDRLRCNQRTSSGDWNVSPGDFVKLRDLSVAVPVGFLVPGAEAADLSFGVQNVRLWKHRDMELFDPEMGGGNLGPTSGSRQILEHIPPPARFSMQLRVSF